MILSPFFFTLYQNWLSCKEGVLAGYSLVPIPLVSSFLLALSHQSIPSGLGLCISISGPWCYVLHLIFLALFRLASVGCFELQSLFTKLSYRVCGFLVLITFKASTAIGCTLNHSKSLISSVYLCFFSNTNLIALICILCIWVTFLSKSRVVISSPYPIWETRISSATSFLQPYNFSLNCSSIIFCHSDHYYRLS